MRALPTGTITFLLTDIEGSTRLGEAHPEAMLAAVARHDGMAAQIIEQHEGVLLKSRGEGDSLFAVFARAADALAAAAALQRALVTEPWPEQTPLRVRIALHTGDAALCDGDYYGSAVNRCARLRAIGHGGQVLLSQTTFDLVRDTLPPAFGLKDLGLHKLRDLEREERVFQLLHPDLPAEFLELRSLGHFPNNLPQQMTSFIGREKEIAGVKQALESTRLLTVTGSGGCGKTRLCLQVAVDRVSEYADGVWLVELAPLADPALVPQALGFALSVREEPGRPLAQTLADYLRAKRLLLILDNCEHLLAACAQLSETLLRACPHVRILASSREGLNIPGEVTYRIPSLSVPDPREMPTVENLSQYDAVKLFAERARAAQPAFQITSQNALALTQLCYRLDGIPLAIELAAARVRALSVEQIAARLDDRFRLLTGGSRTALPRQQTLRAAIDWSYNLLTPEERTLLRRLSVFAAGWTLEAAEKVCADEPGLDATEMPPASIEEWQVLDLLSSLVDKNLVVYDEEENGQGRYRLLETVRQYGRDRILESGEGKGIRDRHRNWFTGLPTRTGSVPESGQKALMAHLEAEHDNLRAALEWCLTEEEGTMAGVWLADWLNNFWSTRGNFAEGRDWLHRFWERLPAAALAERAAIRGVEGKLAWLQGDAAALSLLKESETLWQSVGDVPTLIYVRRWLGCASMEHGDYATARAIFEDALARPPEKGRSMFVAQALLNLGQVSYGEGDYAGARTQLEEALALFREMASRRDIAMTLGHLGDIARQENDRALSRSLWQESLRLLSDVAEKRLIVFALEGVASLEQSAGRSERAARLWGAATAQRDAMRLILPPHKRPEREHGMAASRNDLGDEAFALTFADGRAMTLAQAVAYALEETEGA